MLLQFLYLRMSILSVENRKFAILKCTFRGCENFIQLFSIFLHALRSISSAGLSRSILTCSETCA